MIYLTISLVRIAPGYINPYYSIRDTSRDLATLLSGSSAISVFRAEGLFNENSLRYTRWEVNRTLEIPEILVMAFRPDKRGKDILAEEYRLVKSYDLYVSPEFYISYPNFVPTITVYKNKKRTGGNHKKSVP